MPSLPRLAAAVAAGALLVVLAAGPAAAHTVTGVAPTDYQSEILGVNPPLAAVSVRLLDLGNRVELVNRGAADVVVLGYYGEPYLRVGPAGVFENRKSPSVAMNSVTAPANSTTTTLPPPSADAVASPSWRRTGGGRSVRWRDRRTRWAAPAPPEVAAAPNQAHVVVAQWLIGIRQGTQDASVSGRITYVPGPSPVPWLGAAAVILAATVAGALLRRWGPALSAALAMVIAVDVVHSFGIAAATHDPVFVQIGRVVLGGIVGTLGWIVGVAAIAPLQDERESGVVGGAVAGFLLAAFSGVGDITTLTRSQVPYAFSAAAARAAVAVTLGAGLGLAVAALIVFRRHPDIRAPD
ncbi:MAG: hypothetical protein JO265_15915 [Acidimicrobiia bacterium]|nr:hypothetical protein [Acidimicrobiia bacterium]